MDMSASALECRILYFPSAGIGDGVVHFFDGRKDAIPPADMPEDDSRAQPIPESAFLAARNGPHPGTTVPPVSLPSARRSASGFGRSSNGAAGLDPAASEAIDPTAHFRGGHGNRPSRLFRALLHAHQTNSQKPLHHSAIHLLRHCRLNNRKCRRRHLQSMPYAASSARFIHK